MPSLRGLAAVALVLAPLAAFAELGNDTLLGAGLRWRPAYAGAATQRAELVPVLRYLGQPWFARSTQGVLEAGWRSALAPGLHLGAQLAYEPGRLARESEFLRAHGVGDLAAGASLGVQLEWDQTLGPVPITVLTRLRKHTDAARGAQADLRLSAGILHSGALSAGVMTQATWADARSTNSFYGLSASQAVASGLPAYAPGSGMLAASAGLLWSLDLGRSWVLLGSLEARRLHGDAAGSPLVQRASSRYITAGLAYRP